MAMVQAYEHSLMNTPGPPPTPGEGGSGRRKRSSGRGRTPNRLQKSYSTESSLNHMVDSPVYPGKGY